MMPETRTAEHRGKPAGTSWFALSVRSRHEYVVRSELEKKGIATFLPGVRKLRQWRDRRKIVEFPVFPGYLFVCIAPEPEAFQAVIKTRGGVSLVSLEPGRPTPVAEEEIESLKTILASGRAFDIYPGYCLGTGVRIRRGPLAGATGVLAKRADAHMFFVNVELLGRSVGLKLSGDDIELVEQAPQGRGRSTAMALA